MLKGSRDEDVKAAVLRNFPAAGQEVFCEGNSLASVNNGRPWLPIGTIFNGLYSFAHNNPQMGVI